MRAGSTPQQSRHAISLTVKRMSADDHHRHGVKRTSPREHRWRINLEYLECKGLGEYRHGNQCLDVDFVEVGSHFRPSSKQYRACGF